MKVGELLSIACERAFVSPGSFENGQHMGEWERFMLDTAKELSDLSQQIALSATSADLVEQELRKCRREERANRWHDVQEGGILHSTSSQPRPVVGSPAAAPTIAPEVLRGIGSLAEELRKSKRHRKK